MLTWIRNKLTAVVVGLFVGLITFVFVFSGVFTSDSNGPGGPRAFVGSVNGEAISNKEFQRNLNYDMQWYQAMGGGKIPEQFLGQVRDSTFQKLVSRKIQIQEMKRLGSWPSEEEIRDTVKEQKSFLKDNQFDYELYKNILSNNGLTPAEYEVLVAEDLAIKAWQDRFTNRVRVSDQELLSEYLLENDKRNIKFVLLNSEASVDQVAVSDQEVKTYIDNPSHAGIIQERFEKLKSGKYKDKKFEEVKQNLARELVALGKTNELQKANSELAEKILPMLSKSTDEKSDKPLNAFLEKKGLKVQKTGLITRTAPFIPGLGEAKELTQAAFEGSLEKPRKFSSIAWVVAAVVVDTQKPNIAKFDDAQKSKLRKSIELKKARELSEAWLADVSKSAKIKKDAAAFGDTAGI